MTTDFAETWDSAVAIARGSMAGKWVSVSANVVLAINAQLETLKALKLQVAEGEELDHYRGNGGRRDWSNVGTWLYPGDRIVVLRTTQESDSK